MRLPRLLRERIAGGHGFQAHERAELSGAALRKSRYKRMISPACSMSQKIGPA